MAAEDKEPKAGDSERRGWGIFESRFHWLLPLALVALGALAGAVSLIWTSRPPPPPPQRQEAMPPPKAPEPEPEPAPAPRVAIVIDDLGGNPRAARELIALPQPLTFAVLPKLAYSREIADAAARAGKEVLLHLPMEPVGYPEKNPGPGALLSSMPPDTMMAVLEEDLRDVPHSIGVNNHMGSLLTEDEAVMRLILSYVKERKLFFLDSYTTPRSVVEAVARDLDLPTASRQVFLDHVPNDSAYVEGQLEKLVATAKRHGAAIGIGHPRRATISALRKRLPKLAEEGVTVVRLSSIVEHRARNSNSPDALGKPD